MASSYKNITADTLVKEGAGKLTGIFCASGSSPTIKIWDSMSAAAPILVNTFTPVTGVLTAFPDGGVTFTRGLYIDVGGTIDCTVFYE